MKFEPHEYQTYTINKMEHDPKVFAVLEMGLGKSVCTLTALDTLINDEFKVNRVLVIAPKRVADDTWQSEIEKWDHLHNLKISKAIGTEQQRIKALKAKADIYTINRENVVWLINYYIENKKKWDFDTIVVDESSSFKNPSAKRTKALMKVAPLAKRMILLTGTPMPNGEMDLFAQVKLLDGGERLGKYITRYRDEFFRPGRRNGNVIYEWTLRSGAKEEIQQRVKDLMVSITAQDNITLPERVDNIIRLDMPPKAMKAYQDMARDLIIDLEKDDQVVAANAAAANTKLLQIVNGSVYYEKDGQRETATMHDVKLEALKEIIEDNEGKPILVFYSFISDYERMKEYFKDLNPRKLETREDIKDWNEGKIQLVLAHPGSIGHGLNIQAGGHIIVWYGVPNNLEWYLQSNARLHRQGQKESVIINHLLMKGTIDELVMTRLQRKNLSQKELIEAIKAQII